ncbi:acyl-CoA dehydrogenase family protein [Caldalkalibacillus salinus]|uniref:acyl-CoA dehydrogenase family protein n=1 Tax=Caldalkalibacillus salinus TaxID=2803787 RepID=UPI0019213A1F|nr:acyl-CoA dehydrogenase family protein [Caldalkalibacillus salinus]
MEKEAMRGASFLLHDSQYEDVFTPEAFSEEQMMMGKMTSDFVAQEVVPVLDEIEAHQFEHSVKLMKKAGELGLVGANIPERYGGVGLDKISATIIQENFARARSFALTYGAHVGIGTLPLVFFGNEEQKKKYLPSLAIGDSVASYALTEPTSGSDALSAKTVAKRSECGQYFLLTGEKQWITNSAFSDVFIVYAKVDGKDFTAFIVERDYPGVSTGPEEKKMGIKGSSTRTLLLDDVKVPVENVLGEIGKGHVIAFNILNVGRFSLAAGCVGSAKRAIDLSIQYAKQRQQFDTPISSFTLIQNKMANMLIQTYVAESMVYRTAGLIEQNLGHISEEVKSDGRAIGDAIAEYAIECSINKVFASEVLDQVIDEAVQIYGGYGFMNEYEVENIYRDSRINRIFEGTNEINRLLIPATLTRKVMKGELDLISTGERLQEELMMLMPVNLEGKMMNRIKHYTQMMKKLFLMVAGTAMKKYGPALEQEQELLAHVADIVIHIFALESAMLRAENAIHRLGEDKASLMLNMTDVYAHETMQALELKAKECISAMEEGDERRTMFSIVRKLTRTHQLDTIALKRKIAHKVIEAEGYITY